MSFEVMSPLPSDPDTSNLGWTYEDEHYNDSCIDLCSVVPSSATVESRPGYKSSTVSHNEGISESYLELNPSPKTSSGEREQKSNSIDASVDIGEIERVLESVHRRPQTLWNTHTETLDGFERSPACTTSSIGCNDGQSHLDASNSWLYYEDTFCSQNDQNNFYADDCNLQTTERIEAKSATSSEQSRLRRKIVYDSEGNRSWAKILSEEARDFQNQEFSRRPNAPQNGLFDPDTDNSFGFDCLKSREVDANLRQVRAPCAHVSRSKKDHDDKSTGELPISDRSFQKTVISSEHSTHRQPAVEVESESSLDPEPEMLLQPETRLISHDQLIAEVKEIYAGLVMVESKCIEVDEQQALAAQEQDPSKQKKLTNEQWQALNSLHRTLLHEHYDFFLASHHPSASPSLRNLAIQYDMPRRMWQHAVHSFLEVLLQRLPDSFNAMNTFIHEAYSTLEHLYEKAPMFRDTWKECLIDLDTYRKALDPGGHRYVKVRCKIASSWFGLDIASREELDDPAGSEVTPSDKTCLPMVINGVTIHGRHDTGAEINCMTHKLATNLRLRIRRNRRKPHSLTLANGKIMRTIGRVRAWCTFAKEPRTRVKCWFHVCSDLTTSLVMGSAFLAATKTLTRFKHRLQKRIPGFGSIPSINFIGTSMKAQRRFACRVDGRLTYVNADSASDLDLMSSYYVKANKLHIDRRREVRKRIKLADQTQAETIGQVKAMIDLDDGSGKVYERVFDVLPGLTSEVLVGEDFLGLVDAFCSHESSFVMVPDSKIHSELNILENLGPVNNFLKNTIWGRGRPSCNPPGNI